ncbi:MAG: hypothetical protein EHM58_15165 [Ignavibacteriae bacterium]|nr:MAG: hypothetical protein EHM58_15165 [Ignavibacteriota bacterium]
MAEKPIEKDKTEEAIPVEENAEIIDKIAENVKNYLSGDKERITERIYELDKEWDIERIIELNAASLALTGIGLSVFLNKKWLILPGVVISFLIEQSIQGWSPPVPLLRKLGVRTRREIDLEKYALKILRGDFDTATGIEQIVTKDADTAVLTSME